MDTPRTDAARIDAEKLFGKFSAPQVFEDLSRTLERELSAKSAECQRLKVIAQRVVIADAGRAHPDYYEGMEGDTADAARVALQVTP